MLARTLYGLAINIGMQKDISTDARVDADVGIDKLQI